MRALAQREKRLRFGVQAQNRFWGTSPKQVLGQDLGLKTKQGHYRFIFRRSRTVVFQLPNFFPKKFEQYSSNRFNRLQRNGSPEDVRHLPRQVGKVHERRGLEQCEVEPEKLRRE